MGFIVDKQTLEDLNLLGKYKPQSIFNVFSSTHTRGGERLLEAMFQHPMTDAEAINKRACIFQCFRQWQVEFPFEKALFDSVDHYLSTSAHSNPVVGLLNTCRRKLFQWMSADQEYEMIASGLADTIEFLNILNDYNQSLKLKKDAAAYRGVLEETEQILHEKAFAWVLQHRGRRVFSLWRLAHYDHLLRGIGQSQLKRVMEIVYYTDVYITVADVARKRGFTIAHAVPSTAQPNYIDLAGVFHPQLPGAVANSLRIDQEKNVIFLTGANMAGKSTFMKSVSIAVYLAHMGFPVAAGKMEFSVQDGLYTSINVADNLNMGYSHFYAEVLRVKQVAEEVSQGKNLLVIFDELFKGTNVKDAYDATVAVTEAFADNRNCGFIISTHIIEAAHTLQESGTNFKFVYFPTVMEGKVPTYTYRLEEGVSNDRHGMRIINNEHILEIIRGKE